MRHGIIKDFDFNMRDFEKFTLGDKVAIVPRAETSFMLDAELYDTEIRDLLALRKDPNELHGKFYAEEEAQTFVTEPLAARELIGFSIEGVIPEGTSVEFRMFNGSIPMIWDETDEWKEATDDWNSVEEIAEGLPFWIKQVGKKFGFVLKLASDTDKKLTPRIYAIKVLMEVEMSYEEDILYRSLKSRLASVITHKEVELQLQNDDETATVSEVDLAEYDILEQIPVEVTNVLSVYEKDDEDRRHDLLSTYDPETKLIGFNEEIGGNSRIVLILECRPSVVVIGQSVNMYPMPTNLPAIAVEDFSEDSVEEGGRDSVVNVQLEWGAMVNAPLITTYSATLMFYTGSGRELRKLAEAVRADFRETPYLHSIGLDEDFDLSTTGGWSTTTRVNLSNKHSGEATLMIHNVPRRFGIGEVDTAIVKSIQLNLS